MVAARGLTVRRGGRTLAGPLDLELGPGEAVLLAGASGSGKSTLLRALAGVLPDEFEVEGARSGARAGYVPQNPGHALLCARVAEEVAGGARNAGLDDPEGRGRAALAALGGEALLGRACRDLSSGEAQRVALAVAIAGGASALLLDEPTAFLDDEGVAALGGTLLDLKARGTPLLVAEHRPERLEGLFDRAVRLVATTPSSPGLQSPRPTSAGPVVIRAVGVGHGFGAQTVLDGIDLELRAGDRVAVFGPNGAGKTTLGRILAGLLRPKTGRVERAGGGRVRPGLDAGLTPPDPDEALLGETVGEEVALGPENLGRVPAPSLLTDLGLAGREGDAPAALSHGARVRLVVGATLATRPAALILDEPTIGADPAAIEALAGLLAEFPGAVVVLTHDRPFARRIGARELTLRDGGLAAGTLEP